MMTQPGVTRPSKVKAFTVSRPYVAVISTNPETSAHITVESIYKAIKSTQPLELRLALISTEGEPETIVFATFLTAVELTDAVRNLRHNALWQPEGRYAIAVACCDAKATPVPTSTIYEYRFDCELHGFTVESVGDAIPYYKIKDPKPPVDIEHIQDIKIEVAEQHVKNFPLKPRSFEPKLIVPQGHPKVRIQIVRDQNCKFELPSIATMLSSGFDLQAFMPDRSRESIPKNARKVFNTGFKFAIPPGYEIQIRSRSGLLCNHGITVANQPGTIDADYRGWVSVILFNISDTDFTVEHGMKIAQGVLCSVVQPTFKLVTEDQLDKTERGDGGFGSTGL